MFCIKAKDRSIERFAIVGSISTAISGWKKELQMNTRISKLFNTALCILIVSVTFFGSFPLPVDAATNMGVTSTTPTAKIAMAYGNLRNLVLKHVTKPGIRQSLLAKLDAAEAAELKGNFKARAGIIQAFINEVKAQSDKAIDSEHASLLIASAKADEVLMEEVIQLFWGKAEKSKGLRASQYMELLQKGTRVQPAFMIMSDKRLEMVCQNKSFLFMIDEAPGAHFGHPVQIVLVDAETGARQTMRTEWWPQIDGKPIFDTVGQRDDTGNTVFYVPPLRTVVSTGVFKWPPRIVGGLGCKAWAIIVCGYDDLMDTFHIDTNGMYHALRNLDVADDHIYYVSPHFMQEGVDQETSKSNVQWAINQVASKAAKNDKVLFFYSSHGSIDWLACYDYYHGGDQAPGISANELDNWLDTIKCKELSIIIEACHSGSLIGKYADGTHFLAEDDLAGDGETNRAIFTSASTDTSSYNDLDGIDDPNNTLDEGSETIWGYVEALCMSWDVDGNKETSFGEAFQYAWDNDVSRIRGWNMPQIEHTGLDINNVYNYCVRPDLIIQNITYSPTYPLKGAVVTFGVTVKNDGAGASRSCKLCIAFGREANPPTFDVPYLGLGDTFFVENSRIMDNTTLVSIIIDFDQVVSESIEDNNIQSFYVNVQD